MERAARIWRAPSGEFLTRQSSWYDSSQRHSISAPYCFMKVCVTCPHHRLRTVHRAAVGAASCQLATTRSFLSAGTAALGTPVVYPGHNCNLKRETAWFCCVLCDNGVGATLETCLYSNYPACTPSRSCLQLVAQVSSSPKAVFSWKIDSFLWNFSFLSCVHVYFFIFMN